MGQKQSYLNNSNLTDNIISSMDNAFIIDRIISPTIFIGVSKSGEGIKINENYYSLLTTKKYDNKVDYEFKSNTKFSSNQNIYLTIEKTDKLTDDLKYNILSYTLNYDNKIENGKIPMIYKSIKVNSNNLDYIDQLQQIKPNVKVEYNID